MYNCSKCGKYSCTSGEKDNLPKVCPTADNQYLDEVMELYKDEENHKIAYNSALVEAEGYCNWTRVEETIQFMKKCEYKKIGLAFCMGLKNEAKILTKILEHNGFEVVSIICKNGSVPKSALGIGENEKISGQKDDIMCNPIGQAKLLNMENVDFNILFGLCVGHDTLAIKYLEAPLTVLVVKDRVLCHNPIGAIYQAEGYYGKKLFK
ncbi:MAG: DUF1847 domain-containing protein [Oscillospiraceae bacterium]